MFRNEKSSADKIRYLTLTDAGKVWMPDTFFRNEKIARFHKILAPNLYIRVFPDGDVLYSIRWHFRNLIAILSRILSSWGPHSSVHVRCFSQGFHWINKLAILTLQAVSFHKIKECSIVDMLCYLQMGGPRMISSMFGNKRGPSRLPTISVCRV